MYTQNQSGLQLKNDLVELEKNIYNLVRDYQNKYNIDVEGSFKNNKETGCISLDIKAEIKPQLWHELKELKIQKLLKK